MSAEDRVWQVVLPDGSAWIPLDARPDDPRASWIYARSTADTFARSVGGKVVEVTRRQKEKLLDQEIETALARPKAPKVTPKAKARSRPFGRAARRAIATAILESVPLTHAARSAVDGARETANDAEYKAALRTIGAGLPDALWVGYDAAHDRGFAQGAEPVWITDDPQGEAPGDWQRISREEIARLLAEDAP